MSSILAIDFGNENLVISAPRKGGVDIINKSSQRLIPSMVAFSDIRRYTGVYAQQQQSMNIKSTITDLKKLIGLKYETEERENLQKNVPFKLVKLDDGYIGVEVKYLKDTRTFRIEQCLSILLSSVFQIANSQDIHAADCVIVVPPWWDERQKRSILASAKIAGFNVLKLLNSTTASSIAYSMFQRKKLPETADKAVPVAFIDFGDSSFSVSIAILYQGLVKVKSFAFDENLGGTNFTTAFVDLLLEKLKHKYDLDPTSNQRAMLRFVQEAEKVKKNLSINRAITFDIQNFMNGIDVRFVVTREEFEEKVADLVKKIEAPILRALQFAGVNKEDIFAVEVHGGASRVKAVKDKIREMFGKDFTQSLNPDECFSIGAGFQAAILSSQYKVNLSVQDVLPYRIMLKYVDNDNRDCDQKVIELFERFTSLPSIKTVPIKVKKNCHLRLFNDHSGEFGIVEIDADKDEETSVDVKFYLSSDGLIQKVESSTESAKVVFKSLFELSEEDFQKCREEEREMIKRDQDEAAIDKARDDLRDYIFTMYRYLTGDFPSFDPSKKIEYLQKIMIVQGWFEENEFERLSLKDYNDQMDILKSFGEPAIACNKAHIEVPAQLKELIEKAENEKKKLDNKDEKFSHITEDERNVVRKEIEDFIDWLKSKSDEVEKLPKYVEITFKISEAQSKLKDIENKVIGIFMKPRKDSSKENIEQQINTDE